MSFYKMIQVGTGFRYTKDKKFIKQSDVPPEIMARMELGKDVPDAAESLNPAARMCIFCGMGSKLPRLINGQTVYLCENHYHEKNMGQTAQRVREILTTT